MSMTSGLPITIQGAVITASSVSFPDTGETAIAETGYVAGDTVSHLMSDGFYHKFECKGAVTVVFATAATMPEIYPDDETNAYWIDLGAVNREAPFQLQRNTRNDATSPYTVEVDPGTRVGSIGIGGNVLADEITVEVYDSTAALIHSETQAMLKRNVYNYKTWVYAKVRQIKKTIFEDLPMASTNTFKITFTRSSGNVKVGSIIAVNPVVIGSAQYKSDVRRDNTSRVNRDAFDNIKINELGGIPSKSMRLVIPKASLNETLDLIDVLGSQVTFWSGLVRGAGDNGYFESLFTIGFNRSFKHSVSFPSHAEASIEIEEL